MTDVQMYWGSSDIPSGIPAYDLYTAYTTNGRGLNITGFQVGPGCDCGCSDRWCTLTFLARFYLSTSRMPELGITYTSTPYVDFSGGFYGETGFASCADDPSAIIGVRVSQYVYQGGTMIATRRTSMPRRIALEDEDVIDSYDMPPRVYIPSYTWNLNRSRTLEIDIEVRFLMYLEGDGEIRFHGMNTQPFTFDIPQWMLFCSAYCDRTPSRHGGFDYVPPSSGGRLPHVP